MIELVVVFALCGFAGGYLVEHSMLVEDWRVIWQSKKVANYVAFVEAQDADEVKMRRLRWLAKGKLYHAVTCGTCFGWHAIWFTMAVAAVAAGLTTAPGLFTALEAFPLWLAASGVHTAAFKLANRYGLLAEE